MGQQHGIGFLQSEQRKVAAQRTLADAQMIFHLINAELNFPALMIEQAQFQSRGQIRIQDGGNQTVSLQDIRIGAITLGMGARGRLFGQFLCDLGSMKYSTTRTRMGFFSP